MLQTALSQVFLTPSLNMLEDLNSSFLTALQQQGDEGNSHFYSVAVLIFTQLLS